MKVTVMSRKDAISYCHKINSKKSVIISISDPYMEYSSKPFCSPSNGVIEILNLSFSDADQSGLVDMYKRKVTAEDLMSDEDAVRVARFVKRHREKDIIVHCDAGISRSAGVAAAILKYLTGDDGDIFNNFWFHPNMWCFRKTLNALFED